MDEKAVAAAIETHLAGEGWEVYKEVPAPSRSKVVDLYAIKGVPDNPRDTLAVEAKSSCSIRVIQQAAFWQDLAHRSAIAVPDSDNRPQRNFVARICKKFGLGFYEVSGDDDRREDGSRDVRVTRRPGKDRMGVCVPDLYEEQKRAVAGTDDPEKRHTELDRTLENLREQVEENGGAARLHSMVDRIDHHYSSPQSAFSSIKKHIRSGRAEDLSLRWQGGQLVTTP